MSYNYIQTFFLDSSAVQGSLETGITKVDLYFRGKPKSSDNKSGLLNPGVEVSLVPVYNGVPAITEIGTLRPTEPTEHGARFAPRFEVARKEWGEIIATTDASIPTSFIFDAPMFVKTKQEYGIVIKFDGNEDFVLWASKKNNPLIGENKPSPGVSDKNVGNLFTYIGDGQVNNIIPQTQTGQINTQTNLITPTLTPDTRFLENNWKPNVDIDLKFKIYVARYFHDGAPVSGNSTIINSREYVGRFPTENLPVEISPNVIRLTAPCKNHEYFTFEIKDSTISSLSSGVRIYQENIKFPGGKANPLTLTCSLANNIVIANSSYIMDGGNTFSASNGFFNYFNKSDNEYIVINNGNSVNIRKIVSVINSIALTLDRPMSFSNNFATFSLSPIAELAGVNFSYFNGKSVNILQAAESTASPNNRFVNNCILSISPNTGGTGYSNSDYLIINGFESVSNKILGGYSAKANLVTNSTGGIINIYPSNSGCGFINPSFITGSNVSILNQNNIPSTGTGLSINPTIGANILIESNTQVKFGNCSIINIEASRIKPEITVNNPLGTSFTVSHKQLYYSTNDSSVFSGKTYYVYSNNEVTTIPVKIFKSHDTGAEQFVTTVMPSRSNQFIIPKSDGSLANSSIYGTEFSNAAIYHFDLSSNNDFIVPFFEPEIINSHYSKYNINNDYTNEHTNYGNAYAKHVTSKVNFNTERQAEDLLVYLTAYKPVGTDIKVYARIHNRQDNESFDDKDWSLLELKDGIGLNSSTTDQTDQIELTYNFVDSPNVDYQCNGTVILSNTTTTTITGSNTLFSTELTTGSLIKITQPLFSSNSFAIAVVNSITNNTSLTITNPITNTGMIGSGLLISKIETFKKQAFNNVLNSNIVKYYNSFGVEFDTYDSVQLKLVMLSNNEYIVPKIDDVRLVGCTA